MATARRNHCDAASTQDGLRHSAAVGSKSQVRANPWSHEENTMTAKHGDAVRGLISTPRSREFEGRVGRIFRTSQPPAKRTRSKTLFAMHSELDPTHKKRRHE